MDRNKFRLSLIIVAVIVLWGIFIWPTPYRCEKVKRPHYKSSRDDVYRVNRFTGSATKIIPIESQGGD